MLQNFLSAAVQLHFLSTRSRRFATAHSTTSRWEIVCIQRPTMRAECSSSRSQIIKLVRSIIGTATAAEQNDDNSSISFNLRTYNTGLEHKRNQRIHHTSSAVCAFELRNLRQQNRIDVSRGSQFSPSFQCSKKLFTMIVDESQIRSDG